MGLCHDNLNYRSYISTYNCWLGHKCVCVWVGVCVFAKTWDEIYAKLLNFGSEIQF
jgi:hypothetical protein